MDSLPFPGTSKPLAKDEAILELPAEGAFCKKSTVIPQDNQSVS
jgi:hypothetical protein